MKASLKIIPVFLLSLTLSAQTDSLRFHHEIDSLKREVSKIKSDLREQMMDTTLTSLYYQFVNFKKREETQTNEIIMHLDRSKRYYVNSLKWGVTGALLTCAGGAATLLSDPVLPAVFFVPAGLCGIVSTALNYAAHLDWKKSHNKPSG